VSDFIDVFKTVDVSKEQPIPSLLQAVVQSIQAGTVTVRLSGSTTNIPGIPYLASYTPVVNDTVWIFKNRSDLWIIGNLGSDKHSLYRARAHASGATVLAAAAVTQIALAAEDWDPNNNFTSSAYTCPIAGYYRVNYAVEAALNNNPQEMVAEIFKNGAEVSIGSSIVVRGGTGGDAIRSVGSDVVSCAAGDVLTLRAFNTGGNTVNTAATNRTWLAVAFDSQ